MGRRLFLILAVMGYKVRTWAFWFWDVDINYPSEHYDPNLQPSFIEQPIIGDSTIIRSENRNLAPGLLGYMLKERKALFPRQKIRRENAV